jgi:geranylgeranyl reductase family protein
MIHDVIVVGAGPGGSSAASFLARQGIDVLLLDKSDFPREKVCGDGLTPQAIYWLDRLGCAEEVLAQTKGVIKSCDLYINGKRTLTGGFPDGTAYPDFAVLLDRRRFDHAILQNALAHGAEFRPGCVVREVRQESDAAVVTARTRQGMVEFRGRIVIGADGVSSAVGRALGNIPKGGVAALSLRTYYSGARYEGAPIKVYFDHSYFPGYGWLFADDDGLANIGLGYAVDPNFPMPGNLRVAFDRFIATEMAEPLAGATRCGPISGGSAYFYRPQAISGDRIMLIGDAANQADPLNGGGIHKAMESAYLAAETARGALAAGDFSRRSLALYDRMWNERVECDWQTAEIFLTIAKNPNLRHFCLFLLEQIGRLTTEDNTFQDFCAGVFSGVVSQSLCLSPRMLYHAFPKDRQAWKSYLDANGGIGRAPIRLMRESLSTLAGAGSSAARDPLPNLDWGMEVAIKSLKLAERHVRNYAQPRYH